MKRDSTKLKKQNGTDFRQSDFTAPIAMQRSVAARWNEEQKTNLQ